ncbi:MAG: nicotinate-nucleotide diphosphorylase (carboxylating) [Candidatus Fluviicola riflensis]|nr:MAG: nicotinate-nucleotide diphosphorylase (carboxylating) [Candidatus Fluviicola riflensis]OGS77238.1 MAG: nicotinate-nucleotide diphosphorylase (carboxylating) [Candidatus Fluviicola riflensis]OGS82173.1 MAG: nicotinate-nucleotide diphosphorylase (carboxylating) [Fluviicola sp. RIFCSPHIGHO2_01_FULL_43_53]OGS87867.1 MAG: nicotinate-nucleotide diphosphorylase (carboxylating) [Fluviicola sp. RIFCSPHIGHO2_12_FULL_43_24]
MIHSIIQTALQEDLGDGDHSSLACIPADAKGEAKLLVKDTGILAGVDLARLVCETYDPSLQFEELLHDGDTVTPGQIAFYIRGKAQSILAVERTLLNFMQRMSGIATVTNQLVKLLEGTSTKLLDTRKTTPGIRYMEKWAVRIGGGVNHRFALYDMIMLKDNHVDFAGGIQQAIERTQAYLRANGKALKVEIEVRNLDELEQVLAIGKVDRIMLDNFTPELLREAVQRIGGRFETEASGGITKETLRSFAETGVDFISVGALTHSFKSLDLSLKASFE